VEVLSKDWQFRRVYASGRKAACKYAVIYYLQCDEGKRVPHFGFVASKRVGNATKRNRAKRLLRESARIIESKLLSKDFHVVFVARKGIIGNKATEVSNEIEKTLRLNGLLGSGP